MSVSSLGGKMMKHKGAVLAGALTSVLGFTASFADHHGGEYPALEMATQKKHHQ